MTTQLTELQKQAVHYADIRKKLWGSPKPKQRPIQQAVFQEPIFIPKFYNMIPKWKLEPIFFDAHMMEWRNVITDRSSPIKTYIRRRALEMGYTYGQILEKTRTKEIVSARQLIMWEIKRLVKPSISFPELGKAFGGFDHTSCLHAVRKMDNEKVRSLVGIDLSGERHDKRQERLAKKRAYNMRRKAEKACVSAQS